MLGLVLALAAFAAILSCALTWGARAAALRRGLTDSPGVAAQVKQVRSVPNIGGVAIFWSIVAPMLVGLVALRVLGDETIGDVSASIRPFLDGLRAQSTMAAGLIGSLLLLHVVGLVDDRRPLGPGPKLAVILGTALVMVVGFDVRLLTFLDGYVGGQWLSIALTVLWLIAVTNAMNFMDNMDGLAAGVGAVAGSLFLIAAVLNGQWFVAMTLALLVGSLVGFLVFNFPRWSGGATIFMGDGGSLVVGFLLAFLTVRTTYVDQDKGLASGAWYGVLMPLFVLAVPLYDMVSVVAIRLAQGRSPFIGDRQHFSHRLLERGLSVRQALAVICGCTAITGISGIVVGRVAPWQAALLGVQTLIVLGTLALYEHASRGKNRGTTEGEAL